MTDTDRIGPASRAACAAGSAAAAGRAAPGDSGGSRRLAGPFRRAVEGSRPARRGEGEGAGVAAAPPGRIPLLRGELAPPPPLPLHCRPPSSPHTTSPPL